MSTPTWWNERRYGVLVHTDLASVPAWSPIGEQSDWYRSHLGEDVPKSTNGSDGGEVALHPRPMVEVLAHHRDRWGHIEHFEDFLPLLSYDDFDAEAWAELVVDAGAGYSVVVAKHHDGWAWWDAPRTQRTMLAAGPRRNVVAEYAAACERNDIVFGASYSLLDWGDPRYPGEAYVDDVLHPHVIDLVERYATSILWAHGDCGHGADEWRTRELLERVRAIDPAIVVNDRWGTTDADAPAASPELVRTFEYDPPRDILDGPWVVCRGLGASLGHNRAERAEHHLSAFDTVALLTEVVAKGGHLMLAVGPDATGAIPELQQRPLREAGEWIRRHETLIATARPWSVWGDTHVRYLDVDGSLYAVDLSGRGHFATLGATTHRIVGVELMDEEEPTSTSPVRFRQDEAGLHVDAGRSPLERRDRQARLADVRVYRIAHHDVERPIELFAPTPREPIDLAPLMRGVSSGDIIQLGDGTYVGPVTVPPGVIVRGLGAQRTTIDGDGSTAVILERGARLEHLAVRGGPSRSGRLPTSTVEVRGPAATIIGCRVDGHVVVHADDVLVRATTASGVVVERADRLSVSRCQLTGMRWDVGVHLVGGAGHEIDSCEIHDHLCAIRASDTTGTVVRGNNLRARWWGVHLAGTDGAHVHGNSIDHTMRGVDIDGGSQALVDGNAVLDGDSGCIVEWGAADCQVTGNRWERCRIGVLAWEAVGLYEHANEAIDLHEPEAAFTSGP